MHIHDEKNSAFIERFPPWPKINNQQKLITKTTSPTTSIFTIQKQNIIENKTHSSHKKRH